MTQKKLNKKAPSNHNSNGFMDKIAALYLTTMMLISNIFVFVGPMSALAIGENYPPDCPTLDIYPLTVNITSISYNRFTVTWVTKNVTRGYIEYAENISGPWTAVYDYRGDGERSTHYCVVDGLEENTTYYVRIFSNGYAFGKSALGTVIDGQPWVIKTPSITQPYAVAITNITMTEFSVSWLTPGPVGGYVLFSESTDFSSAQKVYDVDGSDIIDTKHYCRVTGLSPNTKYYIKIVSVYGSEERVYGTDNDGAVVLGGKPWSVHTTDDSGIKNVYIEGRVVDAQSHAVSRALVYIQISIYDKSVYSYRPTYFLSEITDDTGKFLINIRDARYEDNNELLNWDPAQGIESSYVPYINVSVHGASEGVYPSPFWTTTSVDELKTGKYLIDIGNITLKHFVLSGKAVLTNGSALPEGFVNVMLRSKNTGQYSGVYSACVDETGNFSVDLTKVTDNLGCIFDSGVGDTMYLNIIGGIHGRYPVDEEWDNSYTLKENSNQFMGIFVLNTNVSFGVPHDITLSNVDAEAFSVSWITDFISVGYVVFGSDPYGLHHVVYDDRGAGFEGYTHHCTVNNLTSGRVYYYKIVSVVDGVTLHFGDDGHGGIVLNGAPWSIELPTPYTTPKNVTISNIYDTSFTVSWYTVSSVTGYSVLVSSDDGASWESYNVTSINRHMHYCVVDGLEPNREYTVKISYQDTEYGPWNVTTANTQDLPEVTNLAPTAFSIFYVTTWPTTVRLLLSETAEPSDGWNSLNGEIEVFYDLANNNSSAGSTLHYFTVSGLSPNTTYYYKLEIGSGIYGYDAQSGSISLSGQPWSVTTYDLSASPTIPYIVYGQTYNLLSNEDQRPLVVVLCYLEKDGENSSVLSSLLRLGDAFVFDISACRAPSGDPMDYSNALLHIKLCAYPYGSNTSTTTLTMLSPQYVGNFTLKGGALIRGSAMKYTKNLLMSPPETCFIYYGCDSTTTGMFIMTNESDFLISLNTLIDLTTGVRYEPNVGDKIWVLARSAAGSNNTTYVFRGNWPYDSLGTITLNKDILIFYGHIKTYNNKNSTDCILYIRIKDDFGNNLTTLLSTYIDCGGNFTLFVYESKSYSQNVSSLYGKQLWLRLYGGPQGVYPYPPGLWENTTYIVSTTQPQNLGVFSLQIGVLLTFNGIEGIIDPGLGDRLTLYWDRAITSFGDVEYRIYMSEEPYNGSSDFHQHFGSPIATVTDLQYTVTNLTLNKRYYFVVRAVDIYGEDDNAKVLVGVPTDRLPPNGITDLRGFTGPYHESVVLTWTVPSDRGSNYPLSGYVIRWSNSTITEKNWNNYKICHNISANVTPSPAGTTENITVEIKDMAAKDVYIAVAPLDQSNNEGPLSNVIKVNVADREPPQFGGITHVSDYNAPTAPSSGSVLLYWNAATDDSNVTYEIYYSLVNTSEFPDLKNDEDFFQKYFVLYDRFDNASYDKYWNSVFRRFEYVVTGLDNFKTYYFVVRAKDRYGNIQKTYDGVNYYIPFNATPTRPPYPRIDIGSPAFKPEYEISTLNNITNSIKISNIGVKYDFDDFIQGNGMGWTNINKEEQPALTISFVTKVPASARIEIYNESTVKDGKFIPTYVLKDTDTKRKHTMTIPLYKIYDYLVAINFTGQEKKQKIYFRVITKATVRGCNVNYTSLIYELPLIPYKLERWKYNYHNIGGNVLIPQNSEMAKDVFVYANITLVDPQERASAAIDSNGVIHVVWQDSLNSTFCIKYSYSTDGGNTWAAPQILSREINGSCMNPSIIVDSDNNVHVVWQGINWKVENTSVIGLKWISEKSTQGIPITYNYIIPISCIYYTFKSSASETFIKPIIISNESKYAINPKIASGGGKVFCVWQEFENEWDVAVAELINGVWSKTVFDEPGAQINPDIVVDENGVGHIVWQDNRFYENPTSESRVGLWEIYYTNTEVMPSTKIVGPNRTAIVGTLPDNPTLRQLYDAYFFSCMHPRIAISTDKIWVFWSIKGGYDMATHVTPEMCNISYCWASRGLNYPDYLLNTTWSSYENITPTIMTNTPINYTIFAYPTPITIDGNLTLLWMGFNDTTLWDILCSEPTNSQFEDATVLLTATNSQSLPTAVNSDSGVVLFWQDNRNGSWDIYIGDLIQNGNLALSKGHPLPFCSNNLSVIVRSNTLYQKSRNEQYMSTTLNYYFPSEYFLCPGYASLIISPGDIIHIEFWNRTANASYDYAYRGVPDSLGIEYLPNITLGGREIGYFGNDTTPPEFDGIDHVWIGREPNTIYVRWYEAADSSLPIIYNFHMTTVRPRERFLTRYGYIDEPAYRMYKNGTISWHRASYNTSMLELVDRNVPGIYQVWPTGTAHHNAPCIVVRFTKPMDAASTNITIIPSVKGQIVWEDAKTLTYVFEEELLTNSTYSVAVSARDIYGIQMDNFTWQFKTYTEGNGPLIVSTWPIGNWLENCPTIFINFTSPINISSIQNGGITIAPAINYSISISNDRKCVVIHCEDVLPYGSTYTIHMSTSITDDNGVPMPTTYTVNFCVKRRENITVMLKNMNANLTYHFLVFAEDRWGNINLSGIKDLSDPADVASAEKSAIPAGDTLPPRFDCVDYPAEWSDHKELTINATIFDDVPENTAPWESGVVESVTLYYALKSLEGPWYNGSVSMERSDCDYYGNGNYTATIPGQEHAGTLYIWIEAVDDLGNANKSEKYAIVIRDLLAPEIRDVVAHPNKGDEYVTGEEIVVEARILDNVGVDTTNPPKVCYWLNSGSKKYAEMHIYSGDVKDGVWRGSIPPLTDVGTLHYYVIASDTSGNENTSEQYEVEVVDINPPQISHEPVSQGELGKKICVYANISDDVWVRDAYVFYVGTDGVEGQCSMELVDGDERDGMYRGYIPEQYTPTDPDTNSPLLEYWIGAVDKCNNWKNTTKYYVKIVSTDKTPPTIRLTAPTEANMGESINVTATVNDNLAISFVRLWYKDVYGGVHNVSMKYLGTERTKIGDWYYEIPPQNDIGKITLYAYTEDTSHNGARSSTQNISIVDRIAPEIEYNHTKVAYSDTDKPIDIYANVTDVGTGVWKVTLYYRLSYEVDWIEMPMTKTDRYPHEYWAQIPAQHVLASLYYYIIAQDYANNTAYAPAKESYYTITLVDLTEPTIVHTPPHYGFVGEDIKIYANISDNIAVDINNVILYYRYPGGSDFLSTPMELIRGNKTDGTYLGVIPAPSDDGYLHYYIIAKDESGNTAMWRNASSPYPLEVLRRNTISVSCSDLSPTYVFRSEKVLMAALRFSIDRDYGYLNAISIKFDGDYAGDVVLVDFYLDNDNLALDNGDEFVGSATWAGDVAKCYVRHENDTKIEVREGRDVYILVVYHIGSEATIGNSVGGLVPNESYIEVDFPDIVSLSASLRFGPSTIEKAPCIAYNSPADGSVDVGVDEGVVVEFSKPMDRRSVENNFELLEDGRSRVQGTFNWEDDYRMVFVPSSLKYSTHYVARIMGGSNGAMDQQGIGLDTDSDGFPDNGYYTFSFYTERNPLPYVVSVSPGGRGYVEENVPVDTEIVVEFSEPMNTYSAENALEINGRAPDGWFRWDGNTMIFTPSTPLDYQTEYTVRVKATAKDLDGAYLDGNGDGYSIGDEEDDYVWSFITEKAPDTNGPVITSIEASPNPTENATYITLNVTASDENSGGNGITDIIYYYYTLEHVNVSGHLSPTDGAYGDSVECATTTINIEDWVDGYAYRIYVRAKDELGNWGPRSYVDVFVSDYTPPEFNGLCIAQNTKMGGEVFLEWDPATDPSTPISYTIFGSTNINYVFSNP
ncbi:MAG: hypothetical protein DRN20_00910, partial [Thermoplasmata archaeon]